MSETRTDLLPTRQSLLVRLRDVGDQESWNEFFITYGNLIYSVALKAGLSDAEAKDVVQETVIATARKMEGFVYDPAKGSFKAWLLRLTHWRVTDQLRRRKHQGIQLDPGTSGTPVFDKIPAPETPVLEQIWDEEWAQTILATAVRHIKNQVHPKQFQIFDLYVLKHWPVRDVARTLGVSLARVYLAKHRVALLLKKEVRQIEAAWNQRGGKAVKK
jgi:RNA polymerase sigma-70 factor (ECF subfamily)